MAKTAITETIEYALFDNYYLKKSQRCALEVSVPKAGRCDFVAMSNDYTKESDVVYTAIEIKTSKSDFKSKHGHNLDWAHKNYYATTPDLVDYIRENVPKHIGIIEVSNIEFSRNTTANELRNDKHYTEVRIVKPAKTLKQDYTPYFRRAIRENIFTANCSNIRTLLKKRYIESTKGAT